MVVTFESKVAISFGTVIECVLFNLLVTLTIERIFATVRDTAMIICKQSSSINQSEHIYGLR